MIRNKYIDHGVHGFLLVCVLITVAVTLSVIFVLSEETWQFFQQVPLPDFLFGTQWQPIIKPQTFGVFALAGGHCIDCGWSFHCGSAHGTSRCHIPQ